MHQPDQPIRPMVYPAVVVLSAAIIAQELVLMRCLQIITWYHFCYFVVSTALLGFGASGTALSLLQRRLAGRMDGAMWLCALLLGTSLPVCFELAQAVPVDSQQVAYRLSQAAMLVAIHLLLLVPFFFGGAAVGLALMAAGPRTPAVYAANLLGSGAGAAGAIGLMFAFRAEQVLWIVAGAAALGAILLSGASKLRLSVALIAPAAVAWLAWPIELRLDPYKPLAQMQRLTDQGDARRLASFDSPRGRIDLFDFPGGHLTLFASPLAPPPPRQLTVLIDGSVQAPLFLIDSPEQAAILDYTPMVAAYRLARPKRVLLLGEVGGTNVWLARRARARQITIVNPNPQILELLRRPIGPQHRAVLAGGDCRAIAAEPRAFIERTQQRYDLIQICSLEAMTAGSRGVMGLAENFLVTRQGLARCISRLTDGGILSVTRGLQEPARDNIRLLATIAEALQSLGVAEPAEHVIQIRNYLAVCTMASRTPLKRDRIERLRRLCQQLGIDPVWYPGIEPAELNRFAFRPGPPGKPYSWYHHAARQIFSADRRQFYRSWLFDIRPATDDRPYFYDFWKWRSLPALWRAYGRAWLARSEWGYLGLVAALGESLTLAAVLILLPLRWLGRPGWPGSARAATFGYFAAIGLAYMFLELALISRFTRLLGDPIYAAAVVLSAFLMFSGLGSLLSQSSKMNPTRLVVLCVAGIGLIGLGYALWLDAIFAAAAGASLPLRAGASLALLGPLALLMGVPFPQGLSRLHARARPLVPWAWGINGFASVVGSSLAVLLAASIGFRSVLVAALLLYLLAAALVARLGPIRPRSDRCNC